MRVLLANVDYRNHMTDEGHQLQMGLQEAGWHLCGKGFDGRTDCKEIVEDLKPQVVIVHDKRDWEPEFWAFRKDIGFTNLPILVDTVPQRLGVVKDAGSMVEYHRRFIDEIKATQILTYYHPESVNNQAHWMADYKQVRTYHSVDAAFVTESCLAGSDGLDRERGIITGATSHVYPLRWEAVKNHKRLGMEVLPHPGYSNRGTRTRDYLVNLSHYKVHLATASSYHFALRKIIESVAVGCIPVTNLPAYDRLPVIDGALVRVPDHINMADLRSVIDEAEASWNLEERLEWAGKCLEWYDYKQMGLRLDYNITEAAC